MFVRSASQGQSDADAIATIEKSIAPQMVVIGMNMGTANPVKKPIVPPKPLVNKK